MATFSTTNFKNVVLDTLTGAAAGAMSFAYVVPFQQGSAPANPEVAITGNKEQTTASDGNYLVGVMGASSGGVSVLGTPTGPAVPANSTGVTGINFARIFKDDATTPVIDVTAGTSGAEMTIGSANSATGVGTTITDFTFRIPLNNGGSLSINTPLANWVVNFATGVDTTSPGFGSNATGTCELRLYSGTAPASADDAATGTLLATISLGDTQIYDAASGGAASLLSSPSALASATGTVGYARFVKEVTAGPTYVIQGSAGTSGTDFILDATSLTSGVTTVSLTEATISI